MSENFIYTSKSKLRKDPSVEYYTLAGSQDFFDGNELPRLNQESDRVYAKKTTRDDGSVRYSIRLSLSNKLYDPTSKLGLDKTKSFLDNTVRNDDRFKNVSHKVFDHYITFLKTQNSSWLLNAQREDE
jgi:hypothetical protein